MEPPRGDPETAATAQLKGQLFLARFEYLKQAHGAGAVDRVLAAMPGEAAQPLRGLARDRWYPFAALAALDRAIAAVVAPEDPEIFEQLGAHSARHRAEWLGEHAHLFSVHGFLSRAADEHRNFHSFGHAAYRRTGFTEGEIAFSGYPETYDTFCLSSRGYFKAAVEVLAGGPATVRERTCQGRGEAACVFDIRWRRPEADPKRP